MDKEKLLDEINTYEQSINALVAMKQHLKYKFDAESFLGRKFRTSKKNAIQPKTDVTPDIASQFPDNSGLVGEVKLPASDELEFKKIVKQMKKYDDELIGWETANEKIENHDLFVLVHQANTKLLCSFISDPAKNSYKYDRKLAIFSFNIDASRNTFYVLEKRGGQLPDKLKEDFREKPVEVNHQHVFREINETKFYDARPPIQYTMWILWDYIFSSMPTEQQYRTSKGRSIIEIEVLIDDLVEKLKRFVPSQGNTRVPELPKKEWVEEALEKFREIGQAKKGEGGAYIIKYWDVPKKKGTTGDFICEKLSSPQKKLKDFSKKKSDRKTNSILRQPK